ncbi:hypothetical protein TSOC_013819 [Tetrabaena socialis]|uniref:Apple domain-containing protein n=1 Tax=Tetrabaena socialis TaxID=47790 RepID=A0A2J7ZJB7_9CHLO|nr:hypothetical protein TSOC_013819 [Tetrabaena socialis]|eukprot:PNH00365.1 hypothetical protein TSOC_013819 [Tetrabaena socialis]
MSSSTRVVVVAVAFTVVATFYSLSELHRMSAMHASADTSKFATHTEDSRVLITGTQQSSSAAVSTAVTSAKPATSSAVTSSSTGGSSSAVSAAGSSGASGSEHKCFTYEHTELWGDVVVWGTLNKKKSAGDCCDACLNFKPSSPDEPSCNVWVYCGIEDKCGSQFQQCWLKHLVHPEASKPARQGPNTSWTSGTIDVDINADPGADAVKALTATGPRKFHTVTSAQGAAVHWQVRIHYYW